MLPEVLAGGALYVIGQSLNWATRVLEAKLLTSAGFANKAVQFHKTLQGVKGKFSSVLPVADKDPAKVVADAASSVGYYAVSTMGGASTCGVIALACIMNGNRDLSETVKKMSIRLEELTREKQNLDLNFDMFRKSMKSDFQKSQAANMEQRLAMLALTNRVAILEGNDDSS